MVHSVTLNNEISKEISSIESGGVRINNISNID